MNLTELNCTICFKHFKTQKELTLVVDPQKETLDRMCDKCLAKFKLKTRNTKTATIIENGKTLLYCYRCELKTKDNKLFLEHDCIKMQNTLKFIKTMVDKK